MMACKRCAADPHPASFGSPRQCAFTEDGAFTPTNWNCLTIAALLDADACLRIIEGDDETMEVINVGDYVDPDDDEGTNGFVVLNRYKRRGRTSSAMHVGDFWPAKPLTLRLAEAVIAWHAPQDMTP